MLNSQERDNALPSIRTSELVKVAIVQNIQKLALSCDSSLLVLTARDPAFWGSAWLVVHYELKWDEGILKVVTFTDILECPFRQCSTGASEMKCSAPAQQPGRQVREEGTSDEERAVALHMVPSVHNFTCAHGEREESSSPTTWPKQSEESYFPILSLEFLLKWNTVYSHSLLLQPLHFTADTEIAILFWHSKML